MKVKYTLINGNYFFADVVSLEEANRIAKNSMAGVSKIEEVEDVESNREDVSTSS